MPALVGSLNLLWERPVRLFFNMGSSITWERTCQRIYAQREHTGNAGWYICTVAVYMATSLRGMHISPAAL